MANTTPEVYEIDKVASTDFVKCSACGGNMAFDPESQTLSCPYCGEHKDFVKDKEVRELDIQAAFAAAEKWEDVSVLSCENCGAKVVITSEEVAKECPYCGTSHVRSTAELAGIKPNALYPFTVTKEQADAFSKKWVKGRLFAPRKFKKNIQAKEIVGVYEPCFTFDSNTTSSYNGRVGYRRTRTVKTKNGVRTETYIEWRYISGTISHFFDDTIISVGSGLTQKELNKLAPFDISTIKVYDKDFLAGYTANHYEKDLSTAWEEAKTVIDEEIRKLIIAKYNCDTVDRINVSTIHENVTYKYVLTPVYVLSYQYKKKTYRVAVNGNTGKVTGKTPLSFWRILLAVLLGAGALAGLVYLMVQADAAEQISLLKSYLSIIG